MLKYGYNRTCNNIIGWFNYWSHLLTVFHEKPRDKTSLTQYSCLHETNSQARVIYA